MPGITYGRGGLGIMPWTPGGGTGFFGSGFTGPGGLPLPGDIYTGGTPVPWRGSNTEAISSLSLMGEGSLTQKGCSILAFFGFTCDLTGLMAAKNKFLSTPEVRGTGPQECVPGFVWDEQRGMCVEEGWRAVAERLIPGGETGTMADIYGEAVLGAFNIPAIVPAQVGTIAKRDGTTAPILNCPPGAVLGKDNLCYMKGSIPMAFRKWRPAPKPPMTGADAKCLRRIGTLQGKIKKLASAAGFTTRKK